MNIETRLRKSYIKRLNVLNKNFFEDQNAGLNIFIEHLKFKRDILILQAKREPMLPALITAIAEFEAFQASKENNQKEFHWNNFCNFLKLNMKEWQVFNDSV